MNLSGYKYFWFKEGFSMASDNRSVVEQIKYWAKIGKITEKNPDLTFEFIKNLLIARQDFQAGKLEAYTFEKKRS